MPKLIQKPQALPNTTSTAQIAEAYDQMATAWDGVNSDIRWASESLNQFLKGLPAKGEILDVGCGAAAFTAEFGARGFKVTGIDVSERMLELARKRVPSGDFQLKDMRQIRELSHKYDGIFALASLLHLPRAELPEMIGELVATCKPEGRIYISIIEAKPKGALEESVTDPRYGDVQRFFSYFYSSEINRWLTDAGCRLSWDRISRVADHTWYEVIATTPRGRSI